MRAACVDERLFKPPCASAVAPAAEGHHDGLLQVLPSGSQKVDRPSHVGQRLFKLAVHPKVKSVLACRVCLSQGVIRRLGAPERINQQRLIIAKRTP